MCSYILVVAVLLHALLCLSRRGSDDSDTPNPCRTPESYLSTGSGSNLSDFSRMSNMSTFKMPEKLQIVKPLEGKA